MKTCTVIAALCLIGFVQQAHTTTCNHRQDCSESECCSKGGSHSFNKYGLLQGTCKKYNTEGNKCELFDILNCSCAPGLSCLPKDSSTENFDFDAERICKKTPKVAVKHKCDKDSDCPVQGECCVKSWKTGLEGFLSIFHNHNRGTCQKFLSESSECDPSDVYECECAAGLKCLYPDESEDGATPHRICMKESKQ